MGGFFGNDETEDYCPFCKTKTLQVIEWDDDFRGQTCTVCENDTTSSHLEIILTSKGDEFRNEIELPDNISWELRFYCDNCGEDVEQSDIQKHSCEDDEEYEINT
jgi:hypothetical protein